MSDEAVANAPTGDSIREKEAGVPERPHSVSVISGLVFIVGTVLVFTAGLSVTTYYWMPAQWTTLSPERLAGGAWSNWLTFTVRWFDWMLYGQSLLGLCLLFVSVQFFRLRGWARTALETLVWIGMGLVVMIGAFWYQLVSRMGSLLRAGERVLSAWSVTYLMVLGFLGLFFLLLVMGTVLAYLRSAPVRFAVQSDLEDGGLNGDVPEEGD